MKCRHFSKIRYPNLAKYWYSIHHFCIRQIVDQGETANCDLSDANTSSLDAYNSEHFVVNAVTDFYDRINSIKANADGHNCDFITHKIDNTPDPLLKDFLKPKRGNDIEDFVVIQQQNKTGLTKDGRGKRILYFKQFFPNF